MKVLYVASAAVVLPLMLILTAAAVLGGGTAGAQGTGSGGVNLDKVPQLAREAHPILARSLEQHCPQLPPLWLIAQAQVESSWNPRAWATDRNGGTGGLLQINQANWVDLGGKAWKVEANTRPSPKHGIWDTTEHLRRGVRLACRNLAQARQTLAENNPLGLNEIEGMLVCHNAGCGTLSAPSLSSGVRHYLDKTRHWARTYAGPATPRGGNNGNPPPVPKGPCGVDKLTPRPNPRSCTGAIQWSIDAVQGECEWLRRCLGMTAHAYGWDYSGEESAATHWDEMQRQGQARAGDTTPPPGALVFWAGGEWGHAAVYLGDGQIASNDITRRGCIDIVDLDVIGERWSYDYLGWAPPYFPNGGGRD